jgi:hypothetical protein
MSGMIPPGDSEYGFAIAMGIILVMIVWGFIHARLLGWL